MSAIFCDTSALFAVIDRDSDVHVEAAQGWRWLIAHEVQLVTTNYVLVEMLALLQRRLGLEAVRRFQADVVPILDIDWIDQHAHERAVEAMLTANRRQLSLVDCASFDAMRRLALETAFAFDQHFVEQGFTRFVVTE